MTRLLAILVLFSLLSGTETANAKRVALVLGNSQYEHIPDLANPQNDANLMAQTLVALGFELTGGNAQLNLDKLAVDRIIQMFGKEIQNADVALFYYAGHGLQVRGNNYLVPVGANPIREADVDFQMFDMNVLLRQMEASGSALNLIVLDACRNNPFSGRGLRSAAGGLAQMKAPEGTLISFATQPGNVALDGSDENSPFTKALVSAIKTPGLDIFRTFNQVGLAVSRATAGAQQPWLSSSPISGEFYFAGASGDQAEKAVDETEMAALKEQMRMLEGRLNEMRQEPDVRESSTADTTANPFDGDWRVSVHSVTGCRSNRNASFMVRIINGAIDEPKQRRPKKGAVTKNGEFEIEVFDRSGRNLATHKGKISGSSGIGEMAGREPNCQGTIELTRFE